MAIKKEPFVNYTLQQDKKNEKRKIIPVSLNLEEQKMLAELMKIIEQDQPSKALRQLMHIAHAYLIHDQKVNTVLGVLFKNKRNNERRGVVDFD